MSDVGQRKKSFVDAKVQGALLRQFVWHWLLTCVLVVGYLFLLESFQTGFRGSWSERGTRSGTDIPHCCWSPITLFPVFVYDALRLSHRFAGPMVNLKKNLSKLARGETVAPLRFRDGDFWQEITNDFNQCDRAFEVNGLRRSATLTGTPRLVGPFLPAHRRVPPPRSKVSHDNSPRNHHRPTKSVGGDAPSRSGVAAVEFAVCLPVLVVLILGSIECCSMIFLRQSLAIVAYEGLRVAVKPETST